MRSSVLMLLGILILCPWTVAYAQRQPFSEVPVEQRELLGTRLEAYVKAHRARNWSALYDLVSDTGRGGVSRELFVGRMKETHGLEFSSFPDLLEFRPDRTEPGLIGGFDIYGCGRAQREGRRYRGVAVVHAVFEHRNWFFTGWTFTDLEYDPCKVLSDPDWEPENRMKWDRPMDELRAIRGIP